MSAKRLKTADELGEMILVQAAALHGPWPPGMTLFIFDDAYGWTASISRPSTEADNFYRTRVLDLTTRLATEYDLDAPQLVDIPGGWAFSNRAVLFAQSPNPEGIDMSKGQQRGNREARKPKREKIKVIAAAPSRKAAAPPFVAATDTAFRSPKSRG